MKNLLTCIFCDAFLEGRALSSPGWESERAERDDFGGELWEREGIWGTFWEEVEWAGYMIFCIFPQHKIMAFPDVAYISTEVLI